MPTSYYKKPLGFFFAFLFSITSLPSWAKLTPLETALNNKNFKLAYKEGQQLLPSQAGEARFDFLFGLAAARVGEYDQAIFAFERVLAHNPNLHPARLELAASHLALGNTSQAKYYLNQLQTAQPKPAKEVMQAVQLYTAAVKAQEEGRMVAKSQGKPSFFVETRLGLDGNPASQGGKEVLLFGWLPWQQAVSASTTTHSLKAGASYFKQQASNWGWFVGGNASQTGFHNHHNLDYYSASAQAGGFLLGQDWRLSLPVQASYQERDDKNKLSLFSLGTDFTKQLNNKTDVNVYTQLASLNFKPSKNLNSLIFNLGTSLSYKYSSALTLSAGPLLGIETAEKSNNKHNSRNLYGFNTEAFVYLSNTSYLNLSFSYIESANKKLDELFLIKRKDETFNLGLKLSHLITKSINFDTQVNFTNQTSNNNLYDYDRMQVSFGLRKDW